LDKFWAALKAPRFTRRPWGLFVGPRGYFVSRVVLYAGLIEPRMKPAGFAEVFGPIEVMTYG